MISEIWGNSKGHLLEIQWNETHDYCFYRPYPWRSVHKRQWKGFINYKRLIKKGYTYVKTI